jgi:hypothetical protein
MDPSWEELDWERDREREKFRSSGESSMRELNSGSWNAPEGGGGGRLSGAWSEFDSE